MIGICIIGVGYWGKNHVRVCKELLNEGKIDYLRIYDIDLQRAIKIASDFDIQFAHFLEDILDDNNITTVIIATPSSTHYNIAQMSLNANKNVFIEKPMTLNSKDAKDLVNLAKERNAILMTGHIFRHHSVIKDLKKRIEFGEFGLINMIIIQRLALGIPRSDMGVVFALAVHDLDIASYLLNLDYPNSIIAKNFMFNQKDVEETTIITAQYSDVVVHIFESWNIPVYGKKRELILMGSEKSAIIDFLVQDKYKIYDVNIKRENLDSFSISEKSINTIKLEYKEPLKEEILYFIDCIRNDCNLRGLIGCRAVGMCEAVLESSKTNKEVLFK